MADDDLRWRDLSQHEGPAEPTTAHRDPGPTEDQPGTPPCTCGTAHPCPRHICGHTTPWLANPSRTAVWLCTAPPHPDEPDQHDYRGRVL